MGLRFGGFGGVVFGASQHLTFSAHVEAYLEHRSSRIKLS